MRWNCRGFTLIELLVVLGIIALLTGIAFPTMSMVRASAKNAQCLSNLRQLDAPIRSYSQSHGDRIPIANMLPAIGLNGPENGLPQLLKGYINPKSQIWLCPADLDEESVATGTSYMYVPGLLRFTPEVQMQVTRTVLLQKNLTERGQAKARTDLEGQLMGTFTRGLMPVQMELVRARRIIPCLWIQLIDILAHARHGTDFIWMAQFTKRFKRKTRPQKPRKRRKNEFRNPISNADFLGRSQAIVQDWRGIAGRHFVVRRVGLEFFKASPAAKYF